MDLNFLKCLMTFILGLVIGSFQGFREGRIAKNKEDKMKNSLKNSCNTAMHNTLGHKPVQVAAPVKNRRKLLFTLTVVVIFACALGACFFAIVAR